MKFQVLLPFFLYLIILIFIVYRTSRSGISRMTDFFLGERMTNRYVIAISSAISARGSWLLIGITSQAYILGLSSLWLVLGFIISEFLLFVYLAPWIRKYSEEKNCLTLSDIFVNRLKDDKHYLRIIISVVLLFFVICFISSQLIDGSRAFYALTGLSPENGIILTAVIVFLFIFFGGSKTIHHSDVFHAIILLIVLIGLPLMILLRREGFENIQAEILDSNPQFFHITEISIGTLLGFLSIGLGSAGNPQLLMKYMSVENTRDFRSLAIINSLISTLLAGGALFTGLFARAYFQTSDSIPGTDTQNVYFGLAGSVLNPLLLGVILISIFAAILSSAGSQLLISSSSVINDLYKSTSRSKQEVSEKKLMFYGKVSLVILVYFSILAGILIKSDFSQLLLFAWAGLGASFGPAILATILWKGTTNKGIRAGVITGAATVILWKSVSVLSDHCYELIPGFVLSIIAIWIGSWIDINLITKRHNRKARYHEIRKGHWRD